MKTIETQNEGSLTFKKNFFIAIGNNGNHTGRNRIWTICSYGFDMKIAAINQLRKYVAEDGDMKWGLKPGMVISADELAELIDSNEIVKFRDCFDIS